MRVFKNDKYKKNIIIIKNQSKGKKYKIVLNKI